MEEKLGNIESSIQEMFDCQLDAAFVEDKLFDLEDRPRWNNLGIDGKYQ